MGEMKSKNGLEGGNGVRFSERNYAFADRRTKRREVCIPKQRSRKTPLDVARLRATLPVPRKPNFVAENFSLFLSTLSPPFGVFFLDGFRRQVGARDRRHPRGVISCEISRLPLQALNIAF